MYARSIPKAGVGSCSVLLLHTSCCYLPYVNKDLMLMSEYTRATLVSSTPFKQLKKIPVCSLCYISNSVYCV